MGILNRLFKQQKRSKKEKAGGKVERNRSRAIAKFVDVGVVLAFILLLASVTLPLAGHAAFPGTNGEIAFQSDRDGNFEIYVMNADGSGQTRLTNNPERDVEPAWSSDGRKITFVSDRDGNPEIYVMNADGSGQTRLTNNPAGDSTPAWSPDGTMIAFTRGEAFGIAQIWVINTDGSGETQLTTDSLINAAPVWSPDGTKIAFFKAVFGGDAEVFVMNADGSGQTNLSNNQAHPDQDLDPDWSPDGTKLAFFRGGRGLSEIWVMNADGSGQTKLSTSSTVGDGVPVWSPDGTKIAFTSLRDGNPEIYVMNADGSGQTRLTNNPGFDYRPDWQPLPISVEIDIKPGSDPNCINANDKGVIPVAILTTDTFEAATVDPLSVTLEGAAVRVKGKSGNAGSLEDVDGDGDLDLVVQIVDDTVLTGKDTATLRGNLLPEFGGTPIEGTDSICIVP